MESIIEVSGSLTDGRIVTAVESPDLVNLVLEEKRIVLLKNIFPHEMLIDIRHAVAEWGRKVSTKLLGLFDPLRVLYNELAAYDLSFDVPPAGPYLHPQLIHYPRGGGFFGRHWHNLLPQKLGFIVALSRYGSDYKCGGTVFELDGRLVDIEGIHDLGDVCIWRYDYPHWVKQSDLRDPFTWNSDDGRWVATLPYFERW